MVSRGFFFSNDHPAAEFALDFKVLQEITVVDLCLISYSKSLVVIIQYIWPEINAAVYLRTPFLD